MKTIEISEASGSLSDYAKELGEEVIVLNISCLETLIKSIILNNLTGKNDKNES